MLKTKNAKMMNFENEELKMRRLYSDLSMMSYSEFRGNEIPKIEYEKNRNFLEKRGVKLSEKPISRPLKNINIDFLKFLDSTIEEYILTRFTMYELYIIFYKSHTEYIVNSNGLRLAKKNATRYINSESSLTYHEKEDMKQKVWNTDYLTFGLILNYVERYELFWDREKGEVVSPSK